jgi:hypothetical protein
MFAEKRRAEAPAIESYALRAKLAAANIVERVQYLTPPPPVCLDLDNWQSENKDWQCAVLDLAKEWIIADFHRLNAIGPLGATPVAQNTEQV